MWWTALLNFLSGGIADKVLDGYKAKLDQGTNADKLAADLAAREIAMQSDVAKQALSNWWSALPIITGEMIVVVYLGKVYLWDAAFHLGSTDAVGGAVGGWGEVIITFAFGRRIVSDVVGNLLKR